MKTSNFLSLLGGLGLFLYGMRMMSTGLEIAAGNKLKKILQKLTTNRFLGILVGALITALIQSSSATTVMVVGFVNSGLMLVSQAVWVIMGANIGSTLTGQLIALDVGALAPLVTFIGVALVVFFKKRKINCIGEIIAGLGILFIGMNIMSESMYPLRESPAFLDMMTNFSNPLYGILVGAIFTALIQSSAASIGILQSLAASGLIGLGGCVYVLFGQNIGTCITSFLASIGASKNAKRTTIIHLSFNLIGTIIFIPLCMFSPLTEWVESWTPSNVPAQIANMHTFFNVTTTILLVPFGSLLAALATKILPGEGEAQVMKLMYVKEHNIGSTAIALSQLYKEVGHMFNIAKSNLALAFKAVLENTIEDLPQINEQEEYLDYLNTEITRYISKISSNDMPHTDSKKINSLFKITGDIERIGDHALNICQYAERLKEKEITFSDGALEEIKKLQSLILTTLDDIAIVDPSNLQETLSSISEVEATIDHLSVNFRQNQIDRMNTGLCTVEACVIYSELLTDAERISDHALNIIEASKKAHLAFKGKFEEKATV